ncbi:hypothetical protein CNMCM5878_003274 [Aspergillus fumigatiaffinis]|jgi:hypothetical protein|nr:hypothetical protein CNMCM5878_003274 [Aspergillus fumigatiaffinis]
MNQCTTSATPSACKTTDTQQTPRLPPCLLGVDLCTPERSSLKFYVTDQVVSWDQVADMWTLRGKRLEDPQCADSLTLLRKLRHPLKTPEGYWSNIRRDFAFGTPPPEDY